MLFVWRWACILLSREQSLNRLGDEKNMEEEFGQEYFQYRLRTGMFLPVLRLY